MRFSVDSLVVTISDMFRLGVYLIMVGMYPQITPITAELWSLVNLVFVSLSFYRLDGWIARSPKNSSSEFVI